MNSVGSKLVFLETSSYLPLIWRTPYTRSLIGLMRKYSAEHEFVLQKDCILEAAGYLSFEDNWKYHPAIRIRRLLERLSDDHLVRLGFPSTAVQLLLGGNIWPQAQYLNFVRHTTFFFVDLLDGISWDDPRRALSEFASRIEERVDGFRELFRVHAAASELALPTSDILPYWGRWYLLDGSERFKIRVVQDPRPYNMTADKLRDIYHYDCATNSSPMPSLMLVANTNFKRNVKTSFASLAFPIVCATTTSAEFFT